MPCSSYLPLHVVNPNLKKYYLRVSSLALQNSNSIQTFCFAKEIPTDYNFLNHYDQKSALFKKTTILKLPDKISLQNFLFINLNKVLPTIFKIGLHFQLILVAYNTYWSNLDCIVITLNCT